MANRYWVNGGVDSNWGSTSNWSLTSGGAGGQSVPTAADDVFLDGSSPNCTLNASARVCKSLTCTGYTATLDMGQQLSVSGNVTLASGMTIAGAATLVIAATATLTSNGKTWPNALTFTTGVMTITFADNWVVNGLVSLSTSTKTLNGVSLSLTCNGGFTAVPAVVGTLKIVLAGGTVTGSSTAVSLDVDIAGNITFAAGTFAWGGAAKSLTYLSGTVSFAGSHTLVLVATSSTSLTLDVSGVTWDAVTLSHSAGTNTVTLASKLVVNGVFTLSASSSINLTVNGESIECRGGYVHALSNTANIQGTTVFKLLTVGTITRSGGVSSGRFLLPLEIDIPGGTVTISGAFSLDLALLKVVAAATIITDAGTWSVGAGGGGNIIVVED